MHILCDNTMVSLELDEGYPTFDVVTTGDPDTDLANAFWECFYATALPSRADYKKLNVVCVSFDGAEYSRDLEGLLDRFGDGWLPDS